MGACRLSVLSLLLGFGILFCRGIEAIAVVTCHELFSWDLPELTDAFVQSLQRPSLQTAEDLKTSLLAAEMGRRAERMKDKIQDAILQELVKIVDMEVSETALMETAKVKYQAFLLEMQAQVKDAFSMVWSFV